MLRFWLPGLRSESPTPMSLAYLPAATPHQQPYSSCIFSGSPADLHRLPAPHPPACRRADRPRGARLLRLRSLYCIYTHSYQFLSILDSRRLVGGPGHADRRKCAHAEFQLPKGLSVDKTFNHHDSEACTLFRRAAVSPNLI